MPILIMCHNSECCELFHVADECAGGEVRCPSCGTVQPIEGSVESEHVPQAPAAVAQTPSEDDQDDQLDMESLLPPMPTEIPQAQPPKHTPAESPPEEIDLAEEEQDEPSADDSPPPGPAGQAGQEKNSDREFEDLFDLSDDDIAQADPAAEGDGDMSEISHMMVFSFLIGILGIAAGIVLGVGFLPYKSLILNVYVGGGLGWVGGFVIAFLLIVSYQGEAGKFRCGVCGNLFSAEKKTCGLCGAPLLQGNFPPLSLNCLKAGAYAVKNKFTPIGMAFSPVVGYLFGASMLYLLRTFPSQLASWRVVLLGLVGIVGLLIFSHWMRFFLAVLSTSHIQSDCMPKAPLFLAQGNLITGVPALCVVGLYVLPMFTLPLLPLGLLMLATAGKADAFRPLKALRALRRHYRDFAILWMFLLLWTAGMFLCVAITLMLLRWASQIVPHEARQVWIVVLSAMKVAFLSAIVFAFLTAIARCIGLFGRYCPYAFRRSDT